MSVKMVSVERFKKLNTYFEKECELICRNIPACKLFRNQKILITGAGGLMGSYLTRVVDYINRKEKLNLDIYILARSRKSLSRLFGILDRLHYIEGDLGDDRLKIDKKFDFIFHLASNASPNKYSIDPVGTILPNIIGVLSLSKYINEHGKFVFISSGEVYGVMPESKVISEEIFGSLNPCDLRSCYGESKRMGENLLISLAREKKFTGVVLRPFHSYGGYVSNDDARIFSEIIRSASLGKDIALTSDGSATRPFCYLGDVVEGIIKGVIYGRANEAYNLAKPDAVISIKALAELVAKIDCVSSKVTTKSQMDNYLKSPILHQLVSIEKAKDELGWYPSTSLHDGFVRSIELQRIVNNLG